MAEPNYAAEMRLPSGKTCADCQHGPRKSAAVRRGVKVIRAIGDKE